MKVCSELLELYRAECREQLRVLKQSQQAGRPNVYALEQKRQEADFKHIYRSYWIAMKLFYPLYERAINGYQANINAWRQAPKAPKASITKALVA